MERYKSDLNDGFDFCWLHAEIPGRTFPVQQIFLEVRSGLDILANYYGPWGGPGIDKILKNLKSKL